MPDLLWDEVKDWFDPETNGTLPDVCVPDTTLADWQAVVDLIRARGWWYEYDEGGQVRRIRDRVEKMQQRSADMCISLYVRPVPEILAIFRLHDPCEISFDVDLRELQTQQRLDDLCAFLRALGRRLSKPVLMYPEGCDTRPFLGYSPEADRVVCLADQ